MGMDINIDVNAFCKKCGRTTTWVVEGKYITCAGCGKYYIIVPPIRDVFLSYCKKCDMETTFVKDQKYITCLGCGRYYKI